MHLRKFLRGFALTLCLLGAPAVSAPLAYVSNEGSASVSVIDTATDKVVATLVRGPVVALAKTKEAINATTLTELDAALEREHAGQASLLRGTDYREGIKAFQERRTATFTDS